MKLSPMTCVIFSGLVWFLIGVFLLTKGLNLIILTTHFSMPNVLLDFLTKYVKDIEQAALVLISIGLFLGFFKARVVFHKTVRRVVQRIFSLPAPIPVSKMYKKSYYFLILGMMGLGMGLKFCKIPGDVLGLIDVAIGSALLNGAVLYFRYAFALRKQKSLEN